jgi:hypothetical protein
MSRKPASLRTITSVACNTTGTSTPLSGESPDAETRKYEGLETLHAVLALSRLIRPTSIGDRYCAHVFHYGLPDSSICAIQYRGISPDVFLSRKQRDWLSVEDAETLRGVMPWLSKEKPMHYRVHRAYWYHEYVMRSSVLDIRFPLVATGLEALINTSEKNSGGQFCARVPQLAAVCGVDFPEKEAAKAWKLRSKLAHAEAFLFGLDTVLPESEHQELYEKWRPFYARRFGAACWMRVLVIAFETRTPWAHTGRSNRETRGRGAENSGEQKAGQHREAPSLFERYQGLEA